MLPAPVPAAHKRKHFNNFVVSLPTNFAIFSTIPFFASAVEAIDLISTVSIIQTWIAVAFIDF